MFVHLTKNYITMKLTSRLFTLGLVASALAYLSFYSLNYESYDLGLIGFILFSGIAIGSFTLLLAEVIEEKTEI